MQSFFQLCLVLALIAGLSAGASAQLLNPSFEASFGVPLDWTLNGGITTVQALVDAGFPTDGTNYLLVWSLGTGPATPHSQEGTFGTEATGTAGAEQTFQFVFPNENDTTISFDMLFMSNDTNNDFGEVSISDGTNTLNLAHLDISDTGTGPPSLTGLPTTPVTTVTRDIGAEFTSATSGTVFTVRIHCGNRHDTLDDSRLYIDNFQFAPGTPLQADTILWSKPTPSVVRCEVHTIVPGREWYGLVSTNINGPIGGGPILGLHIAPEIFQQITFPVGTPCIHNLTDPNGDYVFNVPAVFFSPGSAFDYIIVTLVGSPSGALVEYVGPAQRIFF